MRNFSKKLAFVLAAAMVFTVFAPAAKAEAADEMAINRASQTLFVNEGVNDKGAETLADGLYGNVQEYDFYVKNKPADYAKTLKFVWSSSDEKVATVDQKGLTNAVGVGTATITCTITDKATGKEVAAPTTKVTVKANAAEVEITNADDFDGQTVKAGDVVDLNRAMYDENGNKTTKRGDFVTDYTRWIAEPATGVTIDQATGKFTFGEDALEQDYTLYCETYQSDKYDQATAKSDEVVVTYVVDKNGFSVEQTTVSEFVVKFDKAVDSLTKADLKVEKVRVNAATGKTYTTKVTVKSVSLNKEKTEAKVVLFGSLTDATNYKVTVNGFEDAFTMTASVGLPVTVDVTAQIGDVNVGDVLTTNAEAVLVAKFFDANGVDVTSTAYKASYSLVEYSKTGSYTLSGDKLKIKKAGEEVGVKAKYQKYDGGKLVVDINETFWFTAEDPAPIYVTGVTDFSLNNFNQNGNQQSLQVQDKSKFTLKVKVATDDAAEQNPTVIAAGSIIAKAQGNPEFSFTAMDPSICNITNTGVLVPYKAGVAGFYVNMSVVVNGKRGEAEPFDVVYIEVKEDSKFAKFSLDKYSVNVGSVAGYDSETIKLTAFDQYDGKFGIGAATVEGVSDNAKVAVAALGKPSAGAEQTITIEGSKLVAAVAGTQFAVSAGNAVTFDFKVKANNYEQYFSVTVQVPSTEGDYVAVESNGTNGVIDALRVVTDKDASKEAKSLTFNAYLMNSGIKVGTQTFSAYPSAENMAAVKAGNYFYKLTKDGNAVNGAYVTATGSSVSIKLSETAPVVSGSAIGAAQVVTYNGTGAGNYLFELYYSYSDGELTQIDASSCTVTVGDKGAYTLVSQDKNSVPLANDYAMKDGEVSSFAVDKLAIAQCFTINGRDGKTAVDFTEATFDVKYDAVKGTGSVYVESITVYESVGDAYVAYDIPVNVVLSR